MRIFRDNANREWTLRLDIGAAKALRDLANFDVGKVGPKELAELLSNPILLGDVLYVLVKDQCEQRKISDVQFAQGLGGDALDSAVDALVPEIIDFFPKRQRQLLAAVWEKSRQAEQAGLQTALARIQDPQFDQLLADTLAHLSGKPSTASPASSAFVPTTTPSAN